MKISSTLSSSWSAPSLLTGYVVLLSVMALTSPSQAYFNRMMSCQQFCKMLAHAHIHQLWCIIDICRNQKLGQQFLRYAKRGREGLDDLGARREIPPPFDNIQKRVKEVWEGPAPADYNH